MTDDTTFGRVQSASPHQTGVSCDGNPAGYSRLSFFIPVVNMGDSDELQICQRAFIEIDITSIPTIATITGMTYTGVAQQGFRIGGDFTCEIRDIIVQPSTYSVLIGQSTGLWNDVGDGTVYFNEIGQPFCKDPPDDTAFSIDFTVNGTGVILTDLQTAVTAGQSWFAWGYKFDAEVRQSASRNEVAHFGDINPNLFISYTLPPDGVDDLVISNLATSTLDLTWTTPNLKGEILNGSQINFTTPFGSPLTVITNNTNSTTNAVSVSGLNQDTPFSFRVSSWTEGGNNATGNIANATTLQFGNFTVGGIELEATNLDFRTWIFDRTDLNDTAYSLSIIYPDTYNATCSFFFKFAHIFSNHSNLATTIPAANQLEATFVFNGTANEVIDVTCIDETDSTTPEGNFLLTQRNFALLQQFEQFRDGTFGTMGMFGAIDLITLFGVVFATIGFNRINESVGGFFMLVILGVMAFFQIIVWPTALSGAIAVVVMLVVMSTRKV